MALVISPNTAQEAVVSIPLCFEGVANVVIPQEDEHGIIIDSSGTNWVFDGPSGNVWQRTSGPNGASVEAYANETVYGLQPFFIQATNWEYTTPGGANNNYHTYVGVMSEENVFYGWGIMKYCNSNNSTCGATSGSNWIAEVRVGPTPVFTRGVNFREPFYMKSDGTSLYWLRKQGGVPMVHYIIPLPQTKKWRFFLGSLWNNNKLHFVTTFKGSYSGPVPATWTTPLGGTLTDEGGDRRCFVTSTPGDYQVCISSEFDPVPLCVDVTVDDLYFVPTDFACGGCAFTGDRITFRSNGGYNGTLTADGGTVLDSLTWEAPSAPGTYNLTYKIGPNTATCQIRVVERLKVINLVNNTLSGLVPGDSFKIVTNYDDANIVWSNISCPNLVSSDGTVTIPSRLLDPCYGMLDCTIRVTLTGVDGGGCANLVDGSTFVDVNVKVDPVFPTPQFGGPTPVKWKPETPDFRVKVNTFEGGCDETYLRNDVPVQRWTVRYDGLPYGVNNPCPTKPCCDDPAGYLNGFDPTYKTAQRLDDFWMTVAGNSGYFTLVDYRTGKVWKRVRFEGTMGRDHINWYKIHSRDLSLIWSPCCAVSPKGGVCQHETILVDTVPPTKPGKIDSYQISGGQRITWIPSVDNIGVKGYEIEIDGVVKTLGNQVTYDFLHDTGDETVSTVRVRAFDFFNNYSDWSAPSTVANPALVVDSSGIVPGDQVTESGVDVVEG